MDRAQRLKVALCAQATRSVFSRLLALAILAGAVSGQTLENLLPPGAKIIETVDVSVGPRKPRQLVLWMLNATRHEREPGKGYCSNIIDGDYWEGRARLSLVDLGAAQLVG